MPFYTSENKPHSLSEVLDTAFVKKVYLDYLSLFLEHPDLFTEEEYMRFGTENDKFEVLLAMLTADILEKVLPSSQEQRHFITARTRPILVEKVVDKLKGEVRELLQLGLSPSLMGLVIVTMRPHLSSRLIHFPPEKKLNRLLLGTHN